MPRLLAPLYSAILLLIPAACGSLTDTAATKPPVEPCAVFEPMPWNGGVDNAPGAFDAVALIIKAGCDTEATCNDALSEIRQVVGDSDATIVAAKSHNVAGAAACGWKLLGAFGTGDYGAAAQ